MPLLVGESTAEALAGRIPLAELDRVTVKGKTVPIAVSAVVPPSQAEALDGHRSLLAAFYAGRLAPADARITLMSTTLPALSGYYAMLRDRLSGRTG